MRTELGRYNTGTHAEVRFYFERQDQTGEFFYVQSGPKGDRRLELNNAVDLPFYRQAVDAAEVLLKAAVDNGHRAKVDV